MKVPMYKTVTYQVLNGEMEIVKEDDSYHLTYHNPIYKNSPFKLPQSFSTSFLIQEILASSEVISFMTRFD